VAKRSKRRPRLSPLVTTKHYPGPPSRMR
jgi:hypothetical protein